MHVSTLPSPRDLASLPVDELALLVLRRMMESKHTTFKQAHFLGDLLKLAGTKMPGDSAYRRSDDGLGGDPPHLGRAFAEAWGWLVAEALIAEAVTGLFGQLPVEGFSFVTRLGERVAKHPRALELVAAERRLGVSLHPRLEERARRQFVMGEFEAAALIALREVEVAVRDRAELSDTVIGTDLMNRAFGQGGPLTDPRAPKAEREGLQSLYRGAVAAFKNPASHRRVRYDNPVEAAEIVLFADLLLRMVDRADIASNAGEGQATPKSH
jgi:uncharacterized protein (TIGR02391 family)